MSADVSRVLADLAHAFAELGRRWYVFGAQAVAAAGVPRFTADVDVTLEASPLELERVLAALAEHGLTPRDVPDLEAFVRETRVIPLTHEGGIPVDVVLAGPGLEEEMLARAVVRKVGRVRVPFLETGDLVVLKVLAGRPKDLEDVRGLLRVLPADLDVRVARERLLMLADVLEDTSLIATFDGLVAEVNAPPRLPARTKRRASERASTSRAKKR